MISAIILLASIATAKEPSIGVTYSRLDLNGQRDTARIIQGWAVTSVTADLTVPLAPWFEFTFAGGKSFLAVDGWNKTFALKSAFIDPSGNLIGAYGENGVSSRRETLSGYNFSLGVRFYLGRH